MSYKDSKPAQRTQIKQNAIFTFFFDLSSLAPLPAAGHRSYIRNKHLCKRGPDESDLESLSNFDLECSRRDLSF